MKAGLTAWYFCSLVLSLWSQAVQACAPPSCSSPLFIERIAESAWVNLDVLPAAGTAGVRSALQRAASEFPTSPVRIRLAPGIYADNLGGEIYAQRLLRGPDNPIWLMATDAAPDATRLAHGINLLGVSYLAIDGVTIGPPTVGAWDAVSQTHVDPQPLQAGAGIHIAGEALYANLNANQNGTLNTAIYGQFAPSHHILVRNVTIQNVFERDAESGETSIGQGMDGMKFNQVTDLWVLNNTVRQTSRHGIDNVGVHRALYAGNLIAQTGGGQGIEAKGGALDVTVERNVFYRVRRVELGGENTDATYYYSADGRWDYEALRMVLRNNLIIDTREAAIEFSGCSDCEATGNTVLFSAAYVPPADGGTVFGGDAVRVHDSLVLDAAEGAGSDCQFWNGSDYVTIDPCWGVGAHAPAPIRRVLKSENVRVNNNAFVAMSGHWGNGLGGSTLPCPLNVLDGSASLHFDFNYWFNGSRALPAEGCTLLPEGAASVYSTSAAVTDPGLASIALDTSTPAKLARSALISLTPPSGSVLLLRGNPQAGLAGVDYAGLPRSTPPAIGALQALPAQTAYAMQARAAYTVTREAQQLLLTDSEGRVQRLQGVQRIWFSDQALALDTDGVAGQAYRIYQAAFNRVPDRAGLGFWMLQMDRGASLAQVAAGFLASAEFTSLYGSNPNNEEFVTRLYNNVLQRAPEAGGFAFWVDVLQRGAARADVLAAFAESAENKALVAPAIANGIVYLPSS